MSILIKGLRMPDCCCNCPCLDGEYGKCNISRKSIRSDKGRLADCPLVELPDHGDLMDRDEAVKRMTEWWRRLYKKYGEYDDYVLGFSAALYFIDEYKAVIPAERSEE